jgi:hypothetical protein
MGTGHGSVAFPLLDGHQRWSDFSIEDRDGETWYWKHCGMLDQPDYERRWKVKLLCSEQNRALEQSNSRRSPDRDGGRTQEGSRQSGNRRTDRNAVGAISERRFERQHMGTDERDVSAALIGLQHQFMFHFTDPAQGGVG